KSRLWALVIVPWALWIALTSIGHFPRFHHFPWAITAANAPKLYRLSRWVLRIIKGVLIFHMFYVGRTTIEIARQNQERLHPLSTVIVVGSLIGTIIWFVIKG